jgi:hypothetical protein
MNREEVTQRKHNRHVSAYARLRELPLAHCSEVHPEGIAHGKKKESEREKAVIDLGHTAWTRGANHEPIKSLTIPPLAANPAGTGQTAALALALLAACLLLLLLLLLHCYGANTER